MRFKIIITIVLVVLWAIFSWKWYTCNIKGFCDDNETITEILDSDGDGFSDAKEIGKDPLNPRDTDGDGIIDSLDDDDDNDGLLTKDEALLPTTAYSADSDNDGLLDNYEVGSDLRNPIDSDNDGVINAVDYDDDNDGIVTRAEQADPNADGNPSDAVDSDANGVADYLDIGSDGQNKN